MPRKNALQDALPHQVHELIEQLGSNLKKARLNRNLSRQEVAEKLGVSRNLIAAAEQGSARSSIALYTALLWLYDLHASLKELAAPQLDEVGLMLRDLKTPRQRASRRKELDNDF